jgi:hypothetical protein
MAAINAADQIYGFYLSQALAGVQGFYRLFLVQ